MKGPIIKAAFRYVKEDLVKEIAKVENYKSSSGYENPKNDLFNSHVSRGVLTDNVPASKRAMRFLRGTN